MASLTTTPVNALAVRTQLTKAAGLVLVAVAPAAAARVHTTPSTFAVLSLTAAAFAAMLITVLRPAHARQLADAHGARLLGCVHHGHDATQLIALVAVTKGILLIPFAKDAATVTLPWARIEAVTCGQVGNGRYATPAVILTVKGKDIHLVPSGFGGLLATRSAVRRVGLNVSHELDVNSPAHTSAPIEPGLAELLENTMRDALSAACSSRAATETVTRTRQVRAKLSDLTAGVGAWISRMEIPARTAWIVDAARTAGRSAASAAQSTLADAVSAARTQVAALSERTSGKSVVASTVAPVEDVTPVLALAPAGGVLAAETGPATPSADPAAAASSSIDDAPTDLPADSAQDQRPELVDAGTPARKTSTARGAAVRARARATAPAGNDAASSIAVKTAPKASRAVARPAPAAKAQPAKKATAKAPSATAASSKAAVKKTTTKAGAKSTTTKSTTVTAAPKKAAPKKAVAKAAEPALPPMASVQATQAD